MHTFERTWSESGPPWDWQEYWAAVDAGCAINIVGYTFAGDGASDEVKAADALNLRDVFRGRPFARRVRFNGCTFGSHLNLGGARFEHSLYLTACTFEKGLRLNGVSVAGRCSLRDSAVSDDDRYWLDWRGLHTGQDLGLIRVTAHAPIDLYNAIIGADLRLDGLHALAKGKPSQDVRTNERLGKIDRVHVAAEMKDKAVNLDGATIGRNLIGYAIDDPRTEGGSRRLLIRGGLDLRASVGGQVAFADAEIDNGAQSRAVNMDAARVEGSVFFADGTRVIGRVDLRARVGGQINFRRAEVTVTPERLAVGMNAAIVDGSVYFRDGTRVVGSIDLRADVGGQVAFSKTQIVATPESRAVNMLDSTVAGSVYFRDGTHVTGSVDLRASVGGQVGFDDAIIDAGGDHAAIRMESATVGKSCSFGSNTLVVGGISFLQAQLRGGLTCSTTFADKRFDRPGTGGDHLPCRHLAVTGGIDLRYADVLGPVVIHGASVGGRILARHLAVDGDLHACGSVIGGVDAASVEQREEFLDRYRGLATQDSAAHRALADAAVSTGERPTAPRDAGNALGAHLRDLWGDGSTPLWKVWETEGTPACAAQESIDLELADIRGNLWLKGSRILGRVNAEDATVTGEANFDRAIIDGDLVLRGATVKGRVFNDETSGTGPYPEVSGTVDARGATLAQVDIRFSRTTSENGADRATLIPHAILLDGAAVGAFRVRGGLEAHDVDGHPRRGGRADDGSVLHRFSVHRMKFADLDLDHFKGPRFFALTGYDLLRVAVALFLAGLTFTVLVRDDESGGTGLPLLVLVLYFSVAAPLYILHVLRCLSGEVKRPVLDFLDASRFSPAFYLDVERWARAAGDGPLADEVFHKRRRRELKEKRPGLDEHGRPKVKGEKPDHGPVVKIWRMCVLDFCFGYGVRPGRAVHLFIMLWMLNWAVFLTPNSVERPIGFGVGPTVADSSPGIGRAETEAQVASADLPNHWPGDGGKPGPDDGWGPQRAFFLAMRLQVPPVELFNASRWRPADRVMFARADKHTGFLTYENYAAVMRAINLVLVPVIIAGATGFLKPKGKDGAG